MIANKDYEESGEISIAIAEGKTAIHYNKATGIWEPFDGHPTLAAGDGELFRIQ